MTHTFLLNKTTKGFATRAVSYFKKQKTRIINPQIRKTQVNIRTNNDWGECRPPYILDMFYISIPLCISNIVNSRIPCKLGDTQSLVGRWKSTPLCQHLPKLRSRARHYIDIELDRHTDETNKIDMKTFSNRDQTFKWIGIWSD